MKALYFGYVAGPLIGALWTFVIAIVVAVVMSFATGQALAPVGLSTLLLGAWLGFVWLPDSGRSTAR